MGRYDIDHAELADLDEPVARLLDWQQNDEGVWYLYNFLSGGGVQREDGACPGFATEEEDVAAAALFGEQMEGWLEANPRVGGYEIHYSATDLEPYSVSVWLEDAEDYGTDGDTCPIFPTKNEARARAVVAVAERLGELIDGSARKETKDDDDPVV